MSDVFQSVKDIIVSKLDCDPTSVRMESSFLEDLGADSLDVVDLAMALEEAFNIEISDEKMQSIKTVGDVVAYIESHL